ncbi:Uncharacterised protein [Acinetobacter baumannii]|nr:Uncharacterised protein [Acinetobacter baumannii]
MQTDINPAAFWNIKWIFEISYNGCLFHIKLTFISFNRKITIF